MLWSGSNWVEEGRIGDTKTPILAIALEQMINSVINNMYI